MKAWYNLTKEEQIVRSKKCAVGCAIIAVVFAILLGMSIHKGMMRVKHCTATTEGEVITVLPKSRYRPQSTLTAEYVVDGVKYKTAGRYRGEYSVFDSGTRRPVTVHYDPETPSVAYAANAPESSWNWIYIFLIVVFGLGIPLFLAQADMIRKNGAVWQAPGVSDRE